MQKDIEEVIFDENKQGVFYKRSRDIYDGLRISTIKSSQTKYGCYSPIVAENLALESLLKKCEELDADAYEIVSSGATDSRQEYDSNPYQGYVSAIFYRKRTK